VVDLCDIVNKLTGCETPESKIATKEPKGHYSRINISLDSVLDNVEFHLAGSFIGVAAITGVATCEIRLNHPHAELINLREVHEINGIFNKIYVTTDGVQGECVIYVCQHMVTKIKTSEKTKFHGMIRNYAKTTSNDVARLTEPFHYIAKKLDIRNTDAVNSAEIGVAPFWGLPSTATFRGYSYRILAEDNLSLSYVDLFYVGYVSTVDDAHVDLRMIATME